MSQVGPSVIDANIFVRGVLSPLGPSGEIVRHWHSSSFIAIVSKTLLQEIYLALSKPKIVERYQISEGERRRLIRQLYVRSFLVSPQSRLRICRDPKDDHLIESAVLAGANYLVTEDSDLLEDHRIVDALSLFHVNVVNAAQFLGILKS